MPRAKPSAPQRLNNQQRRNQNWNLGQDAGHNAATAQGIVPNNILQLDLSSSDDEDEDYHCPDPNQVLHVQIPSEDQTPPVKRSRKLNKFQGADSDPLLQDLLESAAFYFTVQTKATEPVLNLGRLQILTEPSSEPESSRFFEGLVEFWVYVSEIPERSFVYTQRFVQRDKETSPAFKDREKKARDPDSHGILRISGIPGIPSEEILESLAPNISAKRRCVFPVLRGYDPGSGMLELGIVTSESRLFRLEHPSDLLSPVPTSVKRLMEWLFSLEPMVYSTENKAEVCSGFFAQYLMGNWVIFRQFIYRC